MECKHLLEDLMGVEGGVICTKCGKHFDHIPKQEKEPAPTKVAAPVKKTTHKAPAKKGAK